jgi:predicted TPR repeat methyltransferase
MRQQAIEALKEALRCRPGCRDTLFQLAAITQSEIPAAAPREYVMALFDQYAPSFDQHLTHTLKYRAPQVIREALLAAPMPKGIEVLDLGCGTGLSGEALRDLARHLIGVDLSPGMVARARERKIYDELIVGDLTAALQHLARPVGAIVACDVFVYIGDLADIFRSASAGLTGGGLFAFSVEADDSTETFSLSRKRRYTHSLKYIRMLAAANKFAEVSSNLKPLRSEGGHDVMGWIVVLRREG